MSKFSYYNPWTTGLSLVRAYDEYYRKNPNAFISKVLGPTGGSIPMDTLPIPSGYRQPARYIRRRRKPRIQSPGGTDLTSPEEKYAVDYPRMGGADNFWESPWGKGLKKRGRDFFLPRYGEADPDFWQPNPTKYKKRPFPPPKKIRKFSNRWFKGKYKQRQSRFWKGKKGIYNPDVVGYKVVRGKPHKPLRNKSFRYYAFS